MMWTSALQACTEEKVSSLPCVHGQINSEMHVKLKKKKQGNPGKGTGDLGMSGYGHAVIYDPHLAALWRESTGQELLVPPPI